MTCGNGMRIAVRRETPLPKDFQSILRNNLNKTELFQLLADRFIVNPSIVCTKLEQVKTKNEQYLNRIDNCNHEEADIRIILHTVDGSQTYKNILIIIGCDAVSIFSKKTAWKVWRVFPEVTETFVKYLFSCQYTLCMTLFSISVSLFQF